MQKPGEKGPEGKEKENLTEQVKRFTDAFEAVSQRFAQLYETDSLRSFQIHEANVRDAAQVAERVAEIQNRKLRHSIAALAMSIAVAAAGFALNSYFEKKRHEREEAQSEVQRKLEKLESISAALTEVRKIKDDALIDCGTQAYDGREVDHKRLAARINLVKACRNADFYFGDDVYSEALSFIQWEASFKDYCAKDIPNDLDWRERHKAVEKKIRKYLPEQTLVQGKR
jgi:hypothetical protein